MQKNLSKLLTESDASLLNNECCTPFSSEYMWVKSPVLGHGAFGTVYRYRLLGAEPSLADTKLLHGGSVVSRTAAAGAEGGVSRPTGSQ